MPAWDIAMATACFLEVTLGPRGEPEFSVPALNSRMTLETFRAFPAGVVGVFMGDTFGEVDGTQRGPKWVLGGPKVREETPS